MYLGRELEGIVKLKYALYDYEAGVFTWHRKWGAIPDLFGVFSRFGLSCTNIGARLGGSGVRLTWLD